MPDRLEKVRSFYQLTDSLFTKQEFKQAVGNLTRFIQGAVKTLEERIDARLAQVKDGKQGPRGEKGDSIVGPQGPRGEKGEQGVQGEPGAPGKDADVQAIARLTLSEVIAEIDKRVPLLGDALKAGLETHIKESLRGFGQGGGTSFSLMQSGVLKVQQPLSLNFKGAGAPTVSVGANGVTHLDFPSGGGGGFTALAATETPNGVITVFTFPSATAQPSYLVVDNVWMKATTAAGTVNWTWNGGTLKATLSIPAADDIWAVV